MGALKVSRTGRRFRKLRKTLEKAESDGRDAMLAALAPALNSLEDDRDTAALLIWALEDRPLPADDVADIFARILSAHGDDPVIRRDLCLTIEAARDLDDLNAPPPDHPLFGDVLRMLLELHLQNDDLRRERAILEALASTARLMGRQKDDLAERSYRRLVELDPENPYAHYGFGLFCKTRGRFAEGMAANQRALDLIGDRNPEAIQWNLGICATGAGAGAGQVALDLWRSLGNTLEIGPHGLPAGGYPMCKVRLAERPLAERTANSDDPGLQESIWVERLSPCHGIVRSVLMQTDLGVDFGDMVLFDGAPITYHRYGERTVAVFPHLATLHPGNHHFYHFAATQPESGVVERVNDALKGQALIYSHTENCYSLCACCWRNEDADHTHETVDHNVVLGRIAVHPDTSAGDILNKIDAAFSGIDGAHLISPDLARAAGQHDRARLENARFNALWSEES